MRQQLGQGGRGGKRVVVDCITLAGENDFERETQGKNDTDYLIKQSDPSAPSQNEVDYSSDKQSQQANRPDETVEYVYCIELLIFAVVGWAWLAIREFLGNTPVMDATVVIVNLVSSLLNMSASLLYQEKQSFSPFARAHLSHTFSLWVFYLYSLIESMAIGDVKICCGGNTTTVSVPLAKSYAATYFGGLQFHQAFGVVTLAYLTVCLIVSAAQARSCANNDSDGSSSSWSLLRETGSTIAVLVSLHCVLFTYHAPLCNHWSDFSAFIATVSFLAWICMVDLFWVYSLFRDFSQQVSLALRWKLGLHFISVALVLLLLIFTACLAAVVGNVFPVATAFLLVTEIISFAVMITIDAAEIRAADVEGQEEGQKQQQRQRESVVIPSAYSNARFSIGRKKRW
jgi:hypothetical protein